jgi:hypothetical protein
MNYLKTALVVAGLLAIGFIGGFHTHRFLATKKIKEVAELRMARGFQTRFFDAVQATEAQRTVLEPIVEKYGKQMALIYQDFRKDRQSLTDSLMNELKPHLDETQWRQLSEFNKPFRGRKPNGEQRSRPAREKVRQ